LIIIVIVNSNKGLSKKEILGEIECVYYIENNEQTDILGKDFKKESDFDIMIDEKLIKYSKTYNFETLGNHQVKIKLYKEINMNYMFKDVYSLESVNMTSDKNCKITSMISTFENCQQLKSVDIIGFNGDKLTSMHKVFYNSGISSFNPQFNFTSNIVPNYHSSTYSHTSFALFQFFVQCSSVCTWFALTYLQT
jgi:hypothetical protein